jgi:tetraacyldisaccharide 4'-kinase
LRRADALLLTNCQAAQESGATLAKYLQSLAPGVPIFSCSTQLQSFESASGQAALSVQQMQSRRPLAFCGLGNPSAFFSMLAAAAIPPVARRIFHDHHRYAAADIRTLERLALDHSADCLLTTEKDLVNLPEDARFSVPLYWAAVQMHPQQPANLLRWIAERLGLPVQFDSMERRPEVPVTK